MDLGIAGRNAVVTGASMGIGHAIADELAANGVNVTLVARRKDRLEEAAHELSTRHAARIVPVAGDMSNAEGVAAAMEAARTTLGDIDILVNNAGSTPSGGLSDMADEVWERSIQLKLMGYMRAARILMPPMCERKWGRIVNIVGLGAYMGSPQYMGGGAINAAVLALTKSLAKTAAPSGVCVNGINPGPIETPRWASLVEQRAQSTGKSIAEERARSVAGIPMGRPGKPEEVAALAAFLCSQRAAFVSGALIEVDGAANGGL